MWDQSLSVTMIIDEWQNQIWESKPDTEKKQIKECGFWSRAYLEMTFKKHNCTVSVSL